MKRRFIALGLVFTMTSAMAATVHASNVVSTEDSTAGINFVDAKDPGPGVVDPENPGLEVIVPPAVKDMLSGLSIYFHSRELPFVPTAYRSWYEGTWGNGVDGAKPPTANGAHSSALNWQSKAGVIVATGLSEWNLDVELKGFFVGTEATLDGATLALKKTGDSWISDGTEYTPAGTDWTTVTTPIVGHDLGSVDSATAAGVGGVVAGLAGANTGRVASGVRGISGTSFEGALGVVNPQNARLNEAQAELVWMLSPVLPPI